MAEDNTRVPSPGAKAARAPAARAGGALAVPLAWMRETLRHFGGRLPVETGPERSDSIRPSNYQRRPN